MLLLLACGLGAADTLTVGPSGTYVTVADAVAASSTGDLIAVEAGTYAGCLDLGGRDLTIAGVAGTVLDGEGACESLITAVLGEALTLQDLELANAGGRGLQLAGGSAVLERVTVSGAGAAALDGGAIWAQGAALTVSGGMLQGNMGDRGGAIYLEGVSTLNLADTEISGGSATWGAGLYAAEGPVSIVVTGSLLSGNVATQHGGAAFLEPGGAWHSEGTEIAENQAGDGHGGGIFGWEAITLSSDGDTWRDNTVAGEASGYAGGALYLGESSALTLSGGALSGNRAWRGGGVYQVGPGTAAVTDSTLEQNSSYESGGAFYGLEGVELTLDTVTLQDNEARYGAGGGVALTTTGRLSLSHSTVDGQTAWESGGAIYLDYGVDAAAEDVEFSANTSTYGRGGAWYHNLYGDLRLSDVRFSGNSAYDAGGAVYLDYLASVLEISDADFDSNTVTQGDGGGLYAEDFFDLQLSRATFTNNQATFDGGAIYLDYLGDMALSDVTLQGNHAENGNGGGLCASAQESDLWPLSLRSVRAEGNAAARHGGGLYATNVGALSLEAVDSLDNTADAAGAGYRGGGLYVYDVGSTAVHASRFCGNRAGDGGGAYIEAVIADERWENNVFDGNVATEDGGALYVTGSLAHTFANNTLVGNQALQGGGVYLQASAAGFLNNAVTWTAAGDGLVAADEETAAASAVTYNLWWTNVAADAGGAFAFSTSEGGNLVADPLYRDWSDNGDCEDDDLRPAEGSPLVDAGEPGLLDADGTRSDIGATGGAASAAPDDDDDGHTDADAGGDDCDDQDPAVYPGAAEVPGDGIDQDCDGLDTPAPGETGETGAPDDTAEGGDGGSGGADTAGGDKGGACGCGSAPGAGWLGLGLLLVAGRRRAAPSSTIRR